MLDDVGRVVVSTIVVLGFIGITTFYVTQKFTGGDTPEILSILLGALASNFTVVVGYWMGSSAGSSSKDKLMKDMVTQQEGTGK